jgi:hypothetical protein
MSKLIDLEALAIEHLKSEHFANYLAECVSTLYRDKLMSEFNNEINRAMDIQVERVIAEYIVGIGQDKIEHLVNQAVRNITKKELLEKL